MTWLEMLRIALDVIGGFAVLAFLVLLCVYVYQRNAEPDEDSDYEYYDYQ